MVIYFKLKHFWCKFCSNKTFLKRLKDKNCFKSRIQLIFKQKLSLYPIFFHIHCSNVIYPPFPELINFKNTVIYFYFQHWNQNSVPRFAGCMQGVAQLLECPICLDTVRRPIFQCTNGHLLCSSCRNKTHQCPVCRISLVNNTARCLVAEKLLGLIVDTFKEKKRQFWIINK